MRGSTEYRKMYNSAQRANRELAGGVEEIRCEPASELGWMEGSKKESSGGMRLRGPRRIAIETETLGNVRRAVGSRVNMTNCVGANYHIVYICVY